MFSTQPTIDGQTPVAQELSSQMRKANEIMEYYNNRTGSCASNPTAGLLPSCIFWGPFLPIDFNQTQPAPINATQMNISNN